MCCNWQRRMRDVSRRNAKRDCDVIGQTGSFDHSWSDQIVSSGRVQRSVEEGKSSRISMTWSFPLRLNVYPRHDEAKGSETVVKSWPSRHDLILDRTSSCCCFCVYCKESHSQRDIINCRWNPDQPMAESEREKTPTRTTAACFCFFRSLRFLGQ